MSKVLVPEQMREWFHDGKTLFVVSHSGGKDSQAQYNVIKGLVAADQIVVIHAVLPGVEWAGTVEHAEATTQGSPFYTVQAKKTFFEMVERRKMWPSAQHRQCTSDLKRDPIDKQVRAILKERGLTRVVNCMGIRAQESPKRAKAIPFKINKRNSIAGREWYDWLPIHNYLIGDVWLEIKKAGQQPHWAYAAGMSRLSCCFCILASKADLTRAAELNPELYAKYVALEKKIGHTIQAPKKGAAPQGLESFTGITAAKVAA
jgi:DNA sulfur modification protein DndC